LALTQEAQQKPLADRLICKTLVNTYKKQPLKKVLPFNQIPANTKPQNLLIKISRIDCCSKDTHLIKAPFQGIEPAMNLRIFM
jgi:hypothetical protein